VIDRLLLVNEVAAHLHCSRRQVENLIARGELASSKFGRRRVVREVTLARFIRERETLRGGRS
jgi:excisionase family DNA binding protein